MKISVRESDLDSTKATLTPTQRTINKKTDQIIKMSGFTTTASSCALIKH